MLDPDQVDNADVNTDVNTDLPDNSAPMMNLDAQSCPPGNVALDSRPMEGITAPFPVVGPRAGLRQWTRGIFARFETVRACGSDPC